jgi:hypothetical protein
MRRLISAGPAGPGEGGSDGWGGGSGDPTGSPSGAGLSADPPFLLHPSKSGPDARSEEAP